MDTLRGNFADRADELDDVNNYDAGEDEAGHDGPPPGIGTDERRMQVRAYNHWAGLLEDRNYPAIEDLEPEELTDFGPYSVLLDFTNGIEDPGISYLGAELATECETGDQISTLADVPSRSLLSRITDHYMQILANQAPIGFEAEFVNQRGATILYRGILLPFSSDDNTIDFIFGVINWKEMADQKATDELLLEIDQALDGSNAEPDSADEDDSSDKMIVAAGEDGEKEIRDPFAAIAKREEEAIGDWADGPASAMDDSESDEDDSAAALAEPGDTEDEDEYEDNAIEPENPGYGVLDLNKFGRGGNEGSDSLPKPSFGLNDDWDDEEEDEDEIPELPAGNMFGSLIRRPSRDPLPEEDDDAPYSPLLSKAAANPHDDAEEAAVAPAAENIPVRPKQPALPPLPAAYEAQEEVFEEPVSTTEITMPDLDEGDLGLYDWLASARELAQSAINSEDRSRTALYDAIGKAYDFSIAALDEPQEFDELLAESGLAKQERAPLTPVVKLVFGVEYDKTRITEYATALGHAHRVGLNRGELADYLRKADGGLKGVVKEERRLRRQESGKVVEERTDPRPAIAKQLRKITPQDFDLLSPDGQEFALVMVRRTEDGEIVLLGEVPNDVALIEKAAKKLLG